MAKLHAYPLLLAGLLALTSCSPMGESDPTSDGQGTSARVVMELDDSLHTFSDRRGTWEQSHPAPNYRLEGRTFYPVAVLDSEHLLVSDFSDEASSFFPILHRPGADFSAYRAAGFPAKLANVPAAAACPLFHVALPRNQRSAAASAKLADVLGVSADYALMRSQEDVAIASRTCFERRTPTLPVPFLPEYAQTQLEDVMLLREIVDADCSELLALVKDLAEEAHPVTDERWGGQAFFCRECSTDEIHVAANLHSKRGTTVDVALWNLSPPCSNGASSSLWLAETQERRETAPLQWSTVSGRVAERIAITPKDSKGMLALRHLMAGEDDGHLLRVPATQDDMPVVLRIYEDQERHVFYAGHDDQLTYNKWSVVRKSCCRSELPGMAAVQQALARGSAREPCADILQTFRNTMGWDNGVVRNPPVISPQPDRKDVHFVPVVVCGDQLHAAVSEIVLPAQSTHPLLIAIFAVEGKYGSEKLYRPPLTLWMRAPNGSESKYALRVEYMDPFVQRPFSPLSDFPKYDNRWRSVTEIGTGLLGSRLITFNNTPEALSHLEMEIWDRSTENSAILRVSTYQPQ